MGENKNLTNCKVCGKEIAKGVKKCPHCGADQRNWFMKHKILSGIIVIVVIAAINSAMAEIKMHQIRRSQILPELQALQHQLLMLLLRTWQKPTKIMK
jgi:uncharacterized protein (UPF0212 family)